MHFDQFSGGGSAFFPRATAAVSTAWESFVAKATLAMKQMQHARMTGVLNAMTDQQLAQINVARKDIPTEAARLVNLDV